jgi:hypothetical protein
MNTIAGPEMSLRLLDLIGVWPNAIYTAEKLYAVASRQLHVVSQHANSTVTSSEHGRRYPRSIGR